MKRRFVVHIIIPRLTLNPHRKKEPTKRELLLKSKELLTYRFGVPSSKKFGMVQSSILDGLTDWRSVSDADGASVVSNGMLSRATEEDHHRFDDSRTETFYQEQLKRVRK